MVKQVSRSGLVDWLVQRCTAVIIGAYVVFLLLYLLCQPQITFNQWHSLFSSFWMRLATIVATVSIFWHAWIGLWTVFTDYIKVPLLRRALEIIVILLLLSYLVWVLKTLWH